MSTTTKPTAVTGLARTVIGPLITTFTAPQQCDIAFVDARPSGLNTAFIAQTCNPVQSYWAIAEATVCWPPATYGVTPTATPFSGWGFYSPGLICPTGRTAACSATGGGSWGWPVQYSIYNAETAYGCCPSGYTCDQQGARITQVCISIVTSGESYLSGSCTFGSLAGQTYITLPLTTSTSFRGVAVAQSTSSLTTFTVVTPVTAVTLFAPMIEIRWQSSDLPATASANTSSAALATPTGQSPGMSTGAKIAIGVAVPLLVLSIVLAAFLLWRRKRARGQNMAAESFAKEHHSQPYTDRQPQRTANVVELETQKEPAEMAAKLPITYDRHELSTER